MPNQAEAIMAQTPRVRLQLAVSPGVEIPAEVSGSGLSRTLLIELYESNWSSLVQTATWLTGEQALAEEVVQDAFIRLVERWHQLDSTAAAPSWLRKTVVNLSRSRMRRFAVGRQKVNLTAARSAHVDESAQRFGEDLVDGKLGQAIRSLPRRQRECVVLRFVYDLAVNDIAATLGIGEGSIKTHLHRGLKTLEQHLAQSDHREDSEQEQI